MDALSRDEAETLARETAAQFKAHEALDRGEYDSIEIVANVGWTVVVVLAFQYIDLPLIARLVLVFPAAMCVPMLFRLKRTTRRLEAAIVLLGAGRRT